MKAIRVDHFGGPEVLVLQEEPDPSPGASQVLIRVKAAGVNPYEAYIRGGGYAIKPPLPYTPGQDAAGVVEAVGSHVVNLKPGDRVYTTGTVTGAYAELTLAEAQHVHPLPERISFAQGAALNVPYGTAYRALFDRANVKPGEIVLIHGATGGVGTAAVQLAAARGCIVFGTGGTERGRQLVMQQGARQVFDHTAPDYADQITRATGGRGVDAIIEMLANANLERDLHLLARFGRVVVVGNRGRTELDPRLTMGKELAILGMQLWARGEGPVQEAHAAIGAGLANGTLNPVVGKQFPLADAAAAQEEVLHGKAYGKVVLIPG